MVLAAPPIRKLHVVGRSRRHARFSLRKHPVSPSLHRGLSPVVYDFALGDEDELVSYTVAKPRKSPVRYYAHSNHLYSVAATTNTAGSVVERYSYNAYGVRTVKNSAGATLVKSSANQDRGFTGYKLDSETGLYYARTRMYSSKLGRFVSRDPIAHNHVYVLGGVVFDENPVPTNGYASGMSLYMAYFAPNKIDPSGMVDVNVAPCEIKIVAGHGSISDPVTFKFPSKTSCAVGGFIGCWPASSNDVPPYRSLPGIPVHDHNMFVFPPKDRWVGTGNDNSRYTGDPDAKPGDIDFDVNAAVDNALIQSILAAKNMCAFCCTEVTITVEISPHGFPRGGRNNFKYRDGYKRVMKCPI